MYTKLVVIDDSVFCHLLHSIMEKVDTSEHYSGIIKAQIAWLLGCQYLEPGCPYDRYKVIRVRDSKPYWRTEYLLNPYNLVDTPRKTKKLQDIQSTLKSLLRDYDRLNTVPFEDMSSDLTIILGNMWEEVTRLTDALKIHYKAGRKFPEYSFTKLKKQVNKVCTDLGVPTLAVPGYEADDLAAMVAKTTYGEDVHTTLLTIDSDWMGLIRPGVEWYCMHGWHPRLRTVDNYNEWCGRRLKREFESPSDIWKYKAISGDKSDNLPAGSPLEVIDLLSPPEQYQLWLNDSYVYRLWSAIDAQKPLVGSIEAATKYLSRKGIPLAIPPHKSSLLD